MASTAFGLFSISPFETGRATQAGNKGMPVRARCLPDATTVGIAGTGRGLSSSSTSCARGTPAQSSFV
eukprot:7874748-Lingulodinium_polyedra.AAC.1